jgi:predicted enzyme related to lactoylglutathione lyase
MWYTDEMGLTESRIVIIFRNSSCIFQMVSEDFERAYSFWSVTIKWNLDGMRRLLDYVYIVDWFAYQNIYEAPEFLKGSKTFVRVKHGFKIFLRFQNI